MQRDELETYLHTHIPLTRAMAVSVQSASGDRVVLGAPLAPNINHRETVFGGSASALAILAAWSVIHVRLSDAAIAARLVVQRNTMSYDRPIAGDFTAVAEAPSAEAWEAFTATLNRHGKARIRVSASLVCGGEIAGRLEADFVAVMPKT